MSSFVFKNSAGEEFTITGPDGMTQAQAEAIFKQQNDTGALTGFTVGAALSAATQAAAGLKSALPQLSQGIGAATNLLGSNVNLNSITAGLGAGGQAATGQIGSALAGTNPAIATNITGASAGVNATVTGGGLSAVTGALTGIAAKAGSLANQAITSLSTTIKGTPTQGINTADLALQAPAAGGIAGLNLSQVTGTLAQASKLVGQGSGQASNSLGVGKFGLDTSQLERAGYVKPGTAAEFLAQGQNDPLPVLNSPTVWTGKDGVKGLTDVLANPRLQDNIQQGLMSSGLKDLKQVGIPVDNLSPQALGGLATNAAKSVGDAAKWATGGVGLSAGVKSAMDSVAKNSAFAVNFTDAKAEEPVLKERIVEPAVDTVNSATVAAAATRVVGNDKVPDITADSGNFGPAKIAVTELDNFYKNIIENLVSIDNTVETLKAQGTISQDQWNTVNEEFQILKATYNNQNIVLAANVQTARNSLPAGSERDAIDQAAQILKSSTIPAFLKAYQALKQKISDLANRIAT